jgi:hypothetical protein
MTMKLFMTKAKLAPSYHLRAWYVTSKQEALVIFNAQVKKMKAAGGGNQLAEVYQVEVRTNLVAYDWCRLLESDAPGPTCDLTPVDLVVKSILLKGWQGGGK